MIEQLKTIRAALDILRGAVGHEENVHTADIALTALTQLEAMVGEPVAWRPISTAPRNGKNILLRFGQDGVSQGKYVLGATGYPWKFIDTNDGITWLINHAVDGPGGPSHWMPMPDAAPVAQQPRQCGLCGSDEAFTGTCGGGKNNPRALCYEPVAQQHETVTNDEQARAYMDARLWEFIDMAGMWPKAKPDPRIWAHVMVYAPVAQQQEPVKPCCMNFEAGTNCFSDPRIGCPRLHPVAQQPQARSNDVARTCPFCNEEWVEQPQADDYKGWYCAHCQRGVDGSEVTYHEQHTVCGRVITDDLPPKQPQAEEVPDVTDAMALAFHRALTDGAIGQSEVEDIKTGLRAAFAAAPQQAEAVPTNCTECRNADSWGVPDQPVCRSCRAGSAWEPLNKSSVNPNKKPQAEAVPPDVARDAVAAEREACAALAQGYAGQVGDVAWAVAAAIRGRGNAALAQQKGGV